MESRNHVRVRTAMVIDDDIDFCRLLTFILEKRKIHVLAVHNLQEAENYLVYLKPSVIFLDNSFPEGLGINSIPYIKSTDPEIKIIMMTGDTALWIKEKAIDEGIDCFLQKPLDTTMIYSALDKLQLVPVKAK